MDDHPFSWEAVLSSIVNIHHIFGSTLRTVSRDSFSTSLKQMLYCYYIIIIIVVVVIIIIIIIIIVIVVVVVVVVIAITITAYFKSLHTHTHTHTHNDMYITFFNIHFKVFKLKRYILYPGVVPQLFSHIKVRKPAIICGESSTSTLVCNTIEIVFARYGLRS